MKVYILYSEDRRILSVLGFHREKAQIPEKGI